MGPVESPAWWEHRAQPRQAEVGCQVMAGTPGPSLSPDVVHTYEDDAKRRENVLNDELVAVSLAGSNRRQRRGI